MIDFLKDMWDALVYETGTCHSENSRTRLARKNRFTKHIQFILWQPGQHGHVHPYWIDFDRYWWKNYRSKR